MLFMLHITFDYNLRVSEMDLGLLQYTRFSTKHKMELEAVNNHHKEHHLGSCSSLRSASKYVVPKKFKRTLVVRRWLLLANACSFFWVDNINDSINREYDEKWKFS